MEPQYNIFCRDRFEKEYKNLFKKHSLGTTIWSPLASGILTGKYIKGIPKKSRFNVKGYEWLKDSFEDIKVSRVKKFQSISKSLDVTPSQLAILWCLNNKNVSTVILGASSLSQLKENLASIDYIEEIDKKYYKKINSL